ncbi:MAG: hypothetical protein BAJALOKI1v1_2130004 [Promethearchaeota archaeon]|nr:MAG: hypothetical protein BAJALOKI1v1_2130004 [Candidatus Lokiarchaeota archaeon]
MNEKNLYEQFKGASKLINRVEIDSKKLTIFWTEEEKEIFYLSNLKKVALNTTDEGPFEPDIFWLLMFRIPIMVPSDELIPGSLKITDYMLELPNFDYDKFIEAMSSTEQQAFELWERE